MKTAHDYAIDFLRYYIERGDSIEKLCRYPRVSGDQRYTVQIGGGSVYFQGRLHHLKPTQLAIKELNKEPCLEIFELVDLYAEFGVLPKPVQMSLW